jgi:transposase InsO family protein
LVGVEAFPAGGTKSAGSIFGANRPNQVWLADITYLRRDRRGLALLAVILDLFTRKVVG